MSSDEGVQKWDPEGPPIFCDSVNNNVQKVKSELNFWFPDDGNLGGDYGSVLKDFAMIILEAAAIGLEVRPNK